MVTGERVRLAGELRLYEMRKNGWLKEHPGQYVVIKDDQVLDFYPTFDVAYRAGASAWGVHTDFLVKQIVEHEPVFFVF